MIIRFPLNYFLNFQQQRCFGGKMLLQSKGRSCEYKLSNLNMNHLFSDRKKYYK